MPLQSSWQTVNILKNYFSRVWQAILDLLWPRTCELCGHNVDRDGRYICCECIERIEFTAVSGCCRICGRSIEGLEHEFLCDDCIQIRPKFERAASAVHFDDEARHLIHRFKYRRALYLTKDLADWMEGVARSRLPLYSIDFIIPMPIVWYHRIKRGYNPSMELAATIAKRIDRKLLPNALSRKLFTRRQAGLSESERRKNAKGTFRYNKRKMSLMRGRTLLLIDDVMTTGATLSAAAETLKSAGAAHVFCLTIARSALGSAR